MGVMRVGLQIKPAASETGLTTSENLNHFTNPDLLIVAPMA